ncbi:MAG TPA: metalloprotease [Candidatus Methanomethylia archaeon]|nr:metalloprotease [Candidatus Methanomethylicia archaeon]
MKFSKKEAVELLIAWIVLSLCFSLHLIFRAMPFPLLPVIVLIYFISVGLSFVVHELTHRYVAIRYGYLAFFHLWPQGVLLALLVSLISGGTIIFAALGAVYIIPLVHRDFSSSLRAEGVIALSGPLSNLVLSLALLPFASFTGILGVIARIGVSVNIWLAAFNSIPLPPLDGSKVFQWNKAAALLLLIASWSLVLLRGVML